MAPGLYLQGLSLAGAFCILLAFAANSLGKWDARSTRYGALNLVGSAILAYVAVVDRQIGFVVLEGSWAIVSAWGLWRAR